MVRVTALASPLLLGFDDLERALDKVAKTGTDGYPRYNIERTAADAGEPEKLRLALAVAGFSKDQIEVTVEENQLTIFGRQREGRSGNFCIAHRRPAVPARFSPAGRDAGQERQTRARTAIRQSRSAAARAHGAKDKNIGPALNDALCGGPKRPQERNKAMRPESNKTAVTAPGLTPQEFAHLGDGSLAYVKAIASEDVAHIFPQAPPMRPGLTLFALLGADGSPIMLTDSKDAAIANAWENELETVSLH
jgi:hypothetical protein